MISEELSDHDIEPCYQGKGPDESFHSRKRIYDIHKTNGDRYRCWFAIEMWLMGVPGVVTQAAHSISFLFETRLKYTTIIQVQFCQMPCVNVALT